MVEVSLTVVRGALGCPKKTLKEVQLNPEFVVYLLVRGDAELFYKEQRVPRIKKVEKHSSKIFLYSIYFMSSLSILHSYFFGKVA